MCHSCAGVVECVLSVFVTVIISGPERTSEELHVLYNFVTELQVKLFEDLTQNIVRQLCTVML